MAELAILDERQSLYVDTLLSQINDLTEATLSAYTADEGDFEEVMRAYIAELNTKIELLQIDVARLRVISRHGSCSSKWRGVLRFIDKAK